MSRQWLWAGALGIAVVLAGCASAPLKPTLEAQGLAADAPAECAAPPPSGDAAVRLARALGYGTLASSPGLSKEPATQRTGPAGTGALGQTARGSR